MISFQNGQNLFGQITQNTSTTNLSLYGTLANIEQRYLLQKYFSDEASFSITTIGSQTLTATGAISLGATSATLSSAWTYSTASPSVTFSDGEIRTVIFTQNSTAITWQIPLTAAVTSALGVGGVQTYTLPPDYSKLKTGTLTIGNLKWTPSEVMSRAEWDNLNVFPYYADIPSRFFIWNRQFQFWPIPSTTGNIITFNYQRRIPDLSLSDYTTPGTVSVANGAIAITGSSTAFTPTTNGVSETRWIQFSPTASSSTSGDNLWYQIASVNSASSITLMAPYQGTSITASSTYTIGQMPLLIEDFQDMLVWKALVYYFTSIVDDEGQRKEYQMRYDEKLELLSEYAGTKTVNVNLSRRPYGGNPNLYQSNFG